MKKCSVFAAVLSYNSEEFLKACIESLSSLELGENVALEICVLDNASQDRSADIAKEYLPVGGSFLQNAENIGFCAGYNQLAKIFLDKGFDYFWLVNPDLETQKGLLKEMLLAHQRHPEVEILCPKLLLAGEQGRIDSCGIVFSSSLRHFDRGQGELDQGQFENEEEVIGGSGACLLLSKAAVKDLELQTDDGALFDIYPALKSGRDQRFQLFDEAFFAYREDAELALRAQRFGIKCLYVPRALAYHHRQVRPEKRRSLAAEINLLGVRNRFLLQMLHFSPFDNFRTLFLGWLFRNVLVVAGVLLQERSSLPALHQAMKLRKRCLQRRKAIEARASEGRQSLYDWFVV